MVQGDRPANCIDHHTAVGTSSQVSFQLGTQARFQLAVNISSFDGLDHAKHVSVQVFYRLSQAHKDWCDVEMETVVVRCSPI